MAATTAPLPDGRSAVSVGQMGITLLDRFVRSIADLVRWGEPWDIEDEDPLLDGDAAIAKSFNLWS